MANETKLTQNSTSTNASAPTQPEKKKKQSRNVEPCKVDHISSIIILTKAFAKAASSFGTSEFKQLAQVRQQFPNYEVQIRTAKASTTRPSAKGLSDAFMEKYVETYHPEDMELYKNQKKFSELRTSPHMYMRNWFIKKYPNWKEAPLSKEKNNNDTASN